MNPNGIDLTLDLVFIKYAQTKFLADNFFDFLLWNGGRVLAKLLSMLHTTGTAPNNLPGRASNAPVVMIALCTNQKATQYTLGVVPGGLSMIGIFINVAAFTFFSLYQEEFIKADNIADVLLIGEQVAEYRLCPVFFSLWGGYPMLKKKISNPAQAHARKVLLINSFDGICFCGYPF